MLQQILANIVSSFENYIHWQIMDVLNELRLYGESLGLQGVALQNFIKEQQAIQIEERKAERELEKQRLRKY